jgi:hypothetical protein
MARSDARLNRLNFLNVNEAKFAIGQKLKTNPSGQATFAMVLQIMSEEL